MKAEIQNMLIALGILFTGWGMLYCFWLYLIKTNAFEMPSHSEDK